MNDLTGRLDDVAATLTNTARDLRGAEPAAALLGADTGGLPGRVGRALHERWVAVLDARAREAADAAAHVGDLAEALHTTAQRYETTDDLAARRLHREW